jgi:hypothetical protein
MCEERDYACDRKIWLNSICNTLDSKQSRQGIPEQREQRPETERNDEQASASTTSSAMAEAHQAAMKRLLACPAVSCLTSSSALATGL